MAEERLVINKGYTENTSNILSPEMLDVSEKLMQAQKTRYFHELDNIEKGFFTKILEAHTKAKFGEELDREDYLLEGHELKEFSRLSNKEVCRYVTYRYKYNKSPELNILSKYPPCVQIEPASICNFRCVMCCQIDRSFSSKSEGYMGFMDMGIFKAAIDELEKNVEAVTFASRGEPMLHPQIGEMLEYASDKFLGLKLNTNASMLSEDNCHKILQSGLQSIVFSVDAFDAQTYEKIRVNGKFEEVKMNIEMFHKIKTTQYPQSNIIAKLSGVKLNPDQDFAGGVKLNPDQDFAEMERFWQGLVDEVAFVPYSPLESAYENITNDIIEPCSDLWRRMFLWWDGKVNPCDYDYKSILTECEELKFPQRSLSDIWNSDFYRNLRNIHITGKRASVEPCKRCLAS
jgi:organic radical activating enzyme